MSEQGPEDRVTGRVAALIALAAGHDPGAGIGTSVQMHGAVGLDATAIPANDIRAHTR